MQNLSEPNNPNLDFSNGISFQFPLFYNSQLFPNCFGLTFTSNMGVTFLPNVSLLSTKSTQSDSKTQELSVEELLKSSNIQKKTNWTPQQDQILKNLVQQQNLEWAQIVKRIPNRTYKMCYSRYQRIKEEKKVNWTKEEQNKIIELVSLFGKRWKHISEQLVDRTPKQIRERYLNYLRPNISHEKWSVEEDIQLVDLIKKYGHQWKSIEKHMSKRSQNQLKNRYYGKLKRVIERKPAMQT